MANADPCSEAHGCGSGTCAGGSCVVSSPATAGSPCDLDVSVCTQDTCDGAGACVPGAALDCAPCGSCEYHLGCVGDLGACDTDPEWVSVALKTDPSGGKGERLAVEIREAVAASDLGDPTADTGYTLCLYRDAAAGGIGAIRLDAAKGFKIVGKGTALPLPATFAVAPLPLTPVTPKVIASDGTTSRCWYHAVPVDQQSPTKLKGRYTAP